MMLLDRAQCLVCLRRKGLANVNAHKLITITNLAAMQTATGIIMHTNCVTGSNLTVLQPRLTDSMHL